MNQIVIIGGSLSQIPFINTAKEMGLRTCVFDRDLNCPGSHIADVFFNISTHDVNKIVLKCKELYKKGGLNGMITYSAYTKPLLAVAKVCDIFGLPSFSMKSVELATNKSLMKECFIKAKISTPEWIVTDNCKEAIKFVEASKTTVIMKPGLGSQGSKGVSLVKSNDNIKKQFQNAFSVSADNTVILEKFYNGREFSVDGIVIDHKPVVLSISEKFNLGPRHNFIMSGFSMGKISDNDKELNRKIDKISKIALQAVRAMDINNSFFSVDVLLTDKDLMVLECGILLDCKIDRLLKFTGVDVYKIILNAVTGTDTEIMTPDYTEGYGLSFMFTDKKGHLRINSENQFEFNGTIEWERRDEDWVSTPSSIADTVGWVIARGRNASEAYNTANKIAKSKLFRII